MANFFEELQGMDEALKKKVLVVSSVVVMAIVIYVWLMYFNNLVVRGTEETIPVAETQEGNPGFWGTMQRGSAVLYQNVAGGIEWLSKALSMPREYIVKPMK